MLRETFQALTENNPTDSDEKAAYVVVAAVAFAPGHKLEGATATARGFARCACQRDQHLAVVKASELRMPLPAEPSPPVGSPDSAE